jgi:D-mannonate dehydratase
MKLEVIGLADAMVSGVQAQALDKVVVEKVNDATEKVIIIQKEVNTKIEEVQQTIEKIEKGHIDWIDTNE